MQRNRDRIANLMDTLRSIIPPSEKQDRLSVLDRAIEHINRLTEENKVCACHEEFWLMQDHTTHAVNIQHPSKHD